MYAQRNAAYACCIWDCFHPWTWEVEGRASMITSATASLKWIFRETQVNNISYK